MKPVSRPIFIVGTGRCGSTAFQRVLSMHREVMWLSGVAYLFPRRPAWNRRAVTAMGNPLLHRILGGVIRPGEQYRFWEEHAHGFSEPFRDLVASDVTPRVKKQVRAAIAPMLTGKRSRLLAKITGWPRMGFLNEIFEDARFVHIIRDGRAVASSLLHVDFWSGWAGPGGWRAGPLSAEDQAAWEASSRSFVTLAGLEWRIQMRAMDAARRALSSERFLEVKYEEFCEQPLETCRRVLDFAELPQSAWFDDRVRAASIRDMSGRWRGDLTPEQQASLDDLLREDLQRYGYQVSPPAREVRDLQGAGPRSR